MFRRMRINTQERAISGDINRLQSFSIRGISEVLRNLLLIQTSESNPNTSVEPTTLATPLAAEIIRGLKVKPAVGTLNILIDPGILVMVDPTGIGADDSVGRPVESAGVTSPGALVMTANASGSVRIDVIECRLNAVPITVTDNRDIFDTATGLFTATAVTKELAQQLEFRVRAGTPGGGFPGNVEGWLPLAVAHVPNGTTTNDTITFWDVRPLVEDRVQGPVNHLTRPEITDWDARWQRVGAASWVVNGVWRGKLKGRFIGGRFRRGSPGTDADTIDFGETANKVAGIAEGSTFQVYAYMCTPFGLPRWSRYTDATSGSRVPREPKGIPILSTTPPLADGTPSASVPLDAVGFAGGATTDALLCFYQYTLAATSNQLREAWFRDKVMTVYGDPLGSPHYVSLSPSGVAGSIATFDVPASAVPANAKAVIATFYANPSIGANTFLECQWNIYSHFDGSTANPSVFVSGGQVRYANPTGGPLSAPMESGMIRIPLTTKEGSAVTVPHKVRWDAGSSTIVGATPFMRIHGWEF